MLVYESVLKLLISLLLPFKSLMLEYEHIMHLLEILETVEVLVILALKAINKHRLII